MLLSRSSALRYVYYIYNPDRPYHLFASIHCHTHCRMPVSRHRETRSVYFDLRRHIMALQDEYMKSASDAKPCPQAAMGWAASRIFRTHSAFQTPCCVSSNRRERIRKWEIYWYNGQWIGNCCPRAKLGKGHMGMSTWTSNSGWHRMESCMLPNKQC